MQSFRKRIAVQKQQKEQPKQIEHKPIPFNSSYADTRAYVTKAIRMYRVVLNKFEPLSDEWATCNDDLFHYTTDLELLDRGTYEDQKEVIKKYGGCIS